MAHYECWLPRTTAGQYAVPGVGHAQSVVVVHALGMLTATRPPPGAGVAIKPAGICTVHSLAPGTSVSPAGCAAAAGVAGGAVARVALASARAGVASSPRAGLPPRAEAGVLMQGMSAASCAESAAASSSPSAGSLGARAQPAAS
jgi:hypothetical protein